MCGIIGYVGSKNCVDILMNGLQRLEYRGYDSAGIAVHASPEGRPSSRGIEIVRAVGKLANLHAALRKTPLSGSPGVGHTRWATHGRPSENNAHPHAAGKVALVHNGIIENHAALRQELEARGARLRSDTDSEILAHLLDAALSTTKIPLVHAVRAALARVRGAYAVAILSVDSPHEIVVARADNPLVVGLGDGEVFCASDIPALLPHTRELVFLEDGEVATLTRDGCAICRLDGSPVTRAPRHVAWSTMKAEKNGYKHFMLKEIHEQPRAVEDTIRGRFDPLAGDVRGDEIGLPAQVASQVERVCFVACGTSAHAGMVGRYWVEDLARLPAFVEIASEVRGRNPVYRPGDLVVAISQSGETIDTLAALRTAQQKGATILAVSNVMDSAIARLADGVFYTRAGPEVGVASTKCFTTQLVAMLLLAIHLGRNRGVLTPDAGRRLLGALSACPLAMREVLAESEAIRRLAKRYARASHVLFFGRSTGYPIALEGALKLKEFSYIHAEGYAAGEMKHGPIALIDDEMPVVVVCPRDGHYEKTFSNMQEVRARQGRLIAVCTRGDEEVRSVVGPDGAQDIVEIPDAPAEMLPFLTVLPLQLFAYFTADLKGTDVDQPRNLAKTVVVE